MSNHTLPPAAAPQAPSAERIAVIGMGCRLPGDTPSPAALWRLLAEGRDAVGALPPERRRLVQGDSLGRGDPGAPGLPPGGYLREVTGFDAAFFGVAGREADVLDPQHRLLLEVTWEALEHAGLPPERMHGTPTAVFTGISYGDYMDQLTGTPRELEGSILTNGHCVAAGRVSYLLGLHGPSVALDTACSSSLVAVHMARQALSSGECDLALAGGVTLTFQPRITRSFARMGMLSASGRCRTFDAGADGFVRGEGCGVVVLKRLADALRDGDRVLAVLRGSATNQDGSSDGLAAPSAAAQRALYREALNRSGTDPRDVGMVETHGTGTPVGDPVEFAGLADVYGDGPGRCALTSVKTNLGHLEPAAGVTGLIKAVLCLQRGAVPANLHFRRWNPVIAADDTRFFVPTELTAWPLPGRGRLAAVSSFGFAGTNAHVLLEQAPKPPAPRRPEEPASPAAPDVFLVPAGSPAVLPAAAGGLADWLAGEGAQVPLRDLAHTLALRRCSGRGRLGVVTGSRRELLAALRAFAAGERHPAVVTGTVDAAVERHPVWVFSGHGSQWPGMGRGLLRTEPAFREALDEADALIRSESRVPVVDILRKGRPVKGCGDVQPVLFALQIALAGTWRSYGVEPAAVIGHSMGEVAAAVVAGALTLADGVRVICRRSGLLSDIAGTGSMLSVGLSADAVREELAACAAETVSVAVLASPDTTVVAGRTAEVSRLAAAWEARGIAVLPIAVDVASHCPLVDPVLPALRSALAGLRPRPPAVRFYSTAVEAGATPSFDADYWCDNLRRPVRFAEAVAAAAADRHQVYVELSPHPVVTHSVERSLSGLATSPTVLPTLRRDEDEPATLRTQLAALHCAGVPVNWRRLYGGGHLVDAPTLTFDRRHHWAEAAARPPAPAAPAGTTLPGQHTEVPGAPVRHCWRADGGTDALPWLADHRVHGSPVMPGAAYCGIALAAATEVFGAAPHEVDVTDVHFEQLLRLGRHTDLSTVVTMAAPDRAHCQILTRDAEGDWERQADAVLHRLTVRPDTRPRPIEALLVRHPVRLDPADLYRNLRGRGLEHGPAFTGITELRTERHHGSYFARITVPARANDPAPGLPVHPVLLDLCAQLAVAPLMHQDDTAPVLPVAVQAVRVLGDPARAEYCHAHISQNAPGGVVAHVRLLDGSGAVVAAVHGLRFVRRAVRSTTAAPDWLLEIGWRRSDRSPAEDGRAPGSWFLVGEADGSARILAAALRSRCARTSVWDRPLDDTPLETLRDSLGERLAAGLEPPRAVVLVCGRRSAAEPAGDALRRTRRLLAAVQAVAAGPAAPRLYVLTQGARNVLPDDTVDLGQSPLRGLVRVAALEHPDLRPALVDADPRTADPADVAGELLADTEDDEVALRAGERWVARLRPAPTGPDRPPTRCTVRYGVDGFRLRAGRLGDLSSLEYAAVGRRPPQRGEVEVRVTAAGLNFRDVLTAMGLLPGDEDVRYRVGFECAGVVSAVGEGVEHLQVGDEVVAVELRGGAFGSFLTLPAEAVAPLPAGLDGATAAGLPIAFLTAWYALRHVARLTSGERVLIHSATGGTGLAAIAVARSLEAEVLATAGSEDKRRFLRGMGIRHVMDSRSLDFGAQVREATGDGVDVVLNSLSGAAIRTGLETLRPFGRFVELGVRDILSDAPLGMRPLRHNVTLRTVDLIELRRHRPAAFAAVWQEVLDAFGAGQLTPLHCTEYPLPEATTAFRTMAAADHTGKLVLTVPSSGQAPAVLPELDLPVRKGGAYLVTGGLRGVGLATAQWLAAQGAGHLVLNGRTAPSPEAARQIAGLGKGSTKVTVVLGDIAEPGTAERLVTTAATGGHRLHGVVHCAMVLDDAVLANVTDEQLEHVWRPKATGAWRLHHATEGSPLDWFAAFSSMASLLGNPGQGAYAAANSWLDGFAAWRAAQGLPTLAVNWGPWGETGVATDFGRRGYHTIPTDEGMAALHCLLTERRVQTGVLPGPADTWLPPAGRHLPFFSDVPAGRSPAPPPAPEDGADVPARLAALPAGLARRTALEEYLADHVRAVLRLGDGAVDPQIPLKSLGFDSLLALELRARIERTFAVSVPRNFVWQHPTLAELAAGIADRLSLGLDAS
ncbi:type I polyketide synthase [Streptomyces sp. RS10V-4]|uniref:type I polyketide synthase n=1 Tax=Streptomyces rhizoryzae TaxID=2932493 RepID=UPI002004A901|nr:type I polyketide synthase [Streptomyces rhizoryzae]MCK7621743.1 type I polyketide synthase [Streptomyces rhizoryzae]